MTNGENFVARCNVCNTALRDFFDFLVENQCPNPKVLACVSESLVNIQSLSEYVRSLRVILPSKKK